MREGMSLGDDRAVSFEQARTVTEPVIDGRICKISGCPKLKVVDQNGTPTALCAASVHRARVPLAVLDEAVAANPDPRPGAGADSNPLMFRMLMAPECVRGECGVTEITHLSGGSRTQNDGEERLA